MTPHVYCPTFIKVNEQIIEKSVYIQEQDNWNSSPACSTTYTVTPPQSVTLSHVFDPVYTCDL